MKKQGKRTWIAVASLLAMLVIDTMLLILYFKTKYLPLLLAAEMLLLPALLNLVLLCFGRDVRVPKARVRTEESSEIAPTEVSEDGSTEETPPKTKRKPIGPRFLAFVQNLPHKLAVGYNRIRRKGLLLLLFLLIAAVHLLFWVMIGRTTSIYSFGYLEPLLLVLAFVVSLAMGKWCRYEETGDGNARDYILDNLSSVFSMQQVTVLLLALAALLKLLAGFDAQRIAVWVVAILLCYETVFILISLAVKLIRREFDREPDIAIPLPFVGRAKDMGILSYLEKNTGITMRSLWSIRLVKHILPYMIVAGVAIFWLVTGVVQIESHQMGAHYRLGRLQEEPLRPGIHLTLPWPLDRVEIYNTDTVKKVTIGYTSTQNTDNTWTGNHGNSEYKLLMGSGDELCSINLRIEYNISDLNEYVKTSASPEKLLESKAYELVTERTISTDLDSLLSVDRNAFAVDFQAELSREIEKYHIGVQVLSVVLESIHPPVEVAKIYQQCIGAELDAQRYLYEAEGRAVSTVEQAKKTAFTAKESALAAKHKAVAAAKADVAEFMASVEADKVNSSAYRYYKYLNAISKAYGSARLVIVSDGIDTSDIYLGDLIPLQ